MVGPIGNATKRERRSVRKPPWYYRLPEWAFDRKPLRVQNVEPLCQRVLRELKFDGCFADSDQAIAVQRRICASCPLLQACEDAGPDKENVGILYGLTQWERRHHMKGPKVEGYKDWQDLVEHLKQAFETFKIVNKSRGVE